MKLDSNAHSVFLLHYHLVLVVKYRREVFDASSRLLKKEFQQIRKRLWKEKFWSQSFCLLTTGGTPIDINLTLASQ